MPKGKYKRNPEQLKRLRNWVKSLKGHKLSKVHREKLSDALKGCKKPKRSQQHCDKISKANKGRKRSEEFKRKVSESCKKNGIGKWMKGRNRPAHVFKNGHTPWNKGKPHPKCAGKNNYFYGKRFYGELNPSWKGGKSYEPYTSAFNQQLKDKIRVRDNFTCQLCGIPELECWRRLDVHHIDYNKHNCEENNLISLCIKCNTKVNKNRKVWSKHFQNKLLEAK